MRRKQDQEHLSNEKVPSDMLNIQGIAFAKKGQLEEAIGCFVKAHKLNPNNPLSWYNIGTSLAMVNKEDKALLILYCYERAIELDPYNAEAWNNKGAIMEMMGNDKSALACYDRSLEIRPGYPSAISNIELLLKKLGYRQASKKHSTPNRKLTAISDALNNVHLIRHILQNVVLCSSTINSRPFLEYAKHELDRQYYDYYNHECSNYAPYHTIQ